MAKKPALPPGPHPGWHAYVDGSHWEGVTTFGVVIVHDDAVIREISRPIPPDREDTGARQIIGELWGAMAAVAWMAREGVKQFTLHYDYTGVHEWAVGLWPARQAYAREYVEYMQCAPLNIRWNYVPGDGQTYYNQLAHNLATQARNALLC